MSENQYDVIVVGSGIGGLAAASLLAKCFGKKVLVLERHSKLGGFTHTFGRPGGYRWDVGVHYVGDLGAGSDLRGLFNLISDSVIQWKKMDDPFEKFVYPDLTFELSSDLAKVRADLKAMFPSEFRNIDAYYEDVRAVTRLFGLQMMKQALPQPIGLLASALFSRSQHLSQQLTGEYLINRFGDERLRAIVASQWGDYGLPPRMSSFLIHAAIVGHYRNGGYYPVGTAEQIAKSIRAVIEKHGGRCLVNHEVRGILLRSGAASGVTARTPSGDENEFDAPVVISDVGARITYLKLLPDYLPLPFKEDLRGFPYGYSTVTLYLGLKESPAKLGFNGANHWIYSGYNHDDMFDRRNDLVSGTANIAFLSFPSLKDPAASVHTAEIVAPLDYDVFLKWKNDPCKKRGEEYEALKKRIAYALLDFVESKYPGFVDLVAFQELSTPLSVEHYTGHMRGDIYGLPSTPERLKLEWLGARTPIKGLYLAGSDASTHGVAGALMGAVVSVVAMNGFKAFGRIFKEARQAAVMLLSFVAATFSYADDVPVAFSGSATWINAAGFANPATMPLNPENRQLQIPSLGLYSDLRPDLRLRALSFQGIARPRFELSVRKPKLGGVYSPADSTGDAKWSEIYAQWTVSDAALLAFGKQNYQWGPAESFSPSNRIFHETVEARTVLYQVTGRYIARSNFTFGQQWSVVTMAEVSDNGENPYVAEQLFEPKIVAKVEYNWNDGADYLAWVSGVREETKPWLGQYGSITLIDGLSLFADAAQVFGSEAWYPVGSNPITLERSRWIDGKLYPLIAAGTRYEFEGGTDIRVEWVHNGQGHTKTERDLMMTSVDANNPVQAPVAAMNLGRAMSPGLEFPGKNYVFLSMRVPDLFGRKNFLLYFRYLKSMTDTSGSFYANAEYPIGDAGTVFLADMTTHGKTNDELRGFVSQAVLAGYRQVW